MSKPRTRTPTRPADLYGLSLCAGFLQLPPEFILTRSRVILYIDNKAQPDFPGVYVGYMDSFYNQPIRYYVIKGIWQENYSGFCTDKNQDVPLPKVTAQPAAQKGAAGSKLCFRIKAEGYQVKYRWQCRSDGGKTWRNVTDKNEGFDSDTLTLQLKDSLNGYLYRCRLTDVSGRHSYSEAAKLRVE